MKPAIYSCLLLRKVWKLGPLLPTQASCVIVWIANQLQTIWLCCSSPCWWLHHIPHVPSVWVIFGDDGQHFTQHKSPKLYRIPFYSTCEGTHVMRWFRPALLSVARANSPQRVERSPGMSLIAVEHSLCGTGRKWTNKYSKWWLDKKGVTCSVRRMTCPVHKRKHMFHEIHGPTIGTENQAGFEPLFFGKHQHSIVRVCDSHYRPHVTTIDRLYTCLCWISHLSYAPVLFVQINCSLCITYGMNSPEMWLIVNSGFSF